MRRTPLLILLALVPVLSLLAACGASGGDDSASSDAKTTTTAAASDGDGTDDEQTTTTAGDDEDQGSGLTSADLAEVLPAAEDIGEGYEMSDEARRHARGIHRRRIGPRDPTEEAVEPAPAPTSSELTAVPTTPAR